MDFEARPEPDPGEREVIREALRRLRHEPKTPGRSAWWREGVRANVEAAPVGGGR